MTVCSLNSQISPASKNRALPIHHETVKYLRHCQSLISSPNHGYCDVFFCGNFFWKFFGSGQSDVRSGNSMTTCCVVNANMALGEPGSQYCITKYGSSYPQIVCWLRVSRSPWAPGVSGVWNYPHGWAYLKCTRSPRTRSHRVSWAHVRSPRIKTFKTFPTKDTSQYPWQGEEIRDSLGLKRFGAFMVNQCTVLWCGRNLWVETAHSHLRCFALCRKTTPNKQRAAKAYKMAMN